MIKPGAFFTSVVDELVQSAESDRELADGIRWLDDQAREKGISFYDAVFDVLYNADRAPGSVGQDHFRN